MATERLLISTTEEQNTILAILEHYFGPSSLGGYSGQCTFHDEKQYAQDHIIYPRATDNNIAKVSMADEVT